MHDVTLVYTEYNHRLEVWVLGKRAANTTADRQQYTNTSKVCDDTMSMVLSKLVELPHVFVRKRRLDTSDFSFSASDNLSQSHVQGSGYREDWYGGRKLRSFHTCDFLGVNYSHGLHCIHTCDCSNCCDYNAQNHLRNSSRLKKSHV